MPRESLYDALGVSRDARPGDIVRAYDRLTAEFRKDTTPPDPRGEARIREAFELLSDPKRREEYDASLAGQPAAPDRKRAIAIAAAVVALGAGATAMYFTGGSPSVKSGRTAMEIQAEAVSSVGRVQSIDMAGKATPTGLAFTIAKGVMATTCEGLAPGAQIVVLVGTRAVPARIAQSDEALGLCKLAVDGAGSWPLPLSGAAPRVGDKVYAAGVNAAGDVVLAEGAVKRILGEARSSIVEATVPAAAGIGGRPLLDSEGRVLAVATATQTGGAARHVILPADWANEPVPPPAPQPAMTPPEPVAASPAPAERGSPSGAFNPIQGRAEETARKLRPPPKVPDDL